MIVTITGIRDLSPESHADVELAMAEIRDADEIRFGGALGVDTIALEAACQLLEEVRLVVIVPFDLHAQPPGPRSVAQRCAHDVVELHLSRNKSAYLRRNDEMLLGADLLVAFTDGREDGGTAYTIRRARAHGKQVWIVPVIGTKQHRWGGARANPELEIPAALAPVHAVLPYVSRWKAHDRATSVILALKQGRAAPADVRWLAEIVAEYIGEHEDLANAQAIVPMPRRAPGVPSDLYPLADAIADLTDHTVIDPEWFVRAYPPEKGETEHHGRLKYPAEEHERTLSVIVHPEWASHGVILLDNVLTKGGTMLGAQRAIHRDTGYAPLGLAVLYVEGLQR